MTNYQDDYIACMGCALEDWCIYGSGLASQILVWETRGCCNHFRYPNVDGTDYSRI